MTLRQSLILSLPLILLQGVILWLEGRVLICTCGYVKLWEHSIWSSGTSQHFADWYSLGHVNHGILFYGLFWLVLRRWSVGARLLLTVITGFLWETIENTDMVIGRFREVTISLEYYGDSVLNSVADSLFMVVGFLIAFRLPALASAALFLGIEAFSTFMVRDGLILNTIMLLYPIEAIKAWQMKGR